MFQSQARCQPRGDQELDIMDEKELLVSISSEMPAPWRPRHVTIGGGGNRWFQSQARCQPRGDHFDNFGIIGYESVSISSEMPAPWRHGHNSAHPSRLPCFNLKRDASPVATTSIWADVSGALNVSISSEMPAPWRLPFLKVDSLSTLLFQSQARCQPRGDTTTFHIYSALVAFQSEARCQPRGDYDLLFWRLSSITVSTSSEMPAQWGPCNQMGTPSCIHRFNLKRDASPVATLSDQNAGKRLLSFN